MQPFIFGYRLHIKPLPMKKYLLFLCCSFALNICVAQKKSFPTSPLEASFVTTDINNFWQAFDKIDKNSQNPFEEYINKGSIGLKGFIPNRIISADELLKMVVKRKAEYEKTRKVDSLIKAKEKLIKPYFYALEYWYPDAVYPPVYFIMGRFNSGGTASPDGLLIGAEMLTSLDHLPELVIHESVHFQQKFPNGGQTNLLQQSIIEGSADFIAELVTGLKGNKKANIYGNAHKEELCAEFVKVMDKQNFEDWLYGTSGKDKRPYDLGYWIGYEITKAYYNQQPDKKQAVKEILNIKDFQVFLRKSGYMNAYLKNK